MMCSHALWGAVAIFRWLTHWLFEFLFLSWCSCLSLCPPSKCRLIVAQLTAALLARSYFEGMMHCFICDSEYFVRSASCESVIMLLPYAHIDLADHCLELPLCCLIWLPLLLDVSWWSEVLAPIVEVGHSVFEYDVSADHHTCAV